LAWWDLQNQVSIGPGLHLACSQCELNEREERGQAQRRASLKQASRGSGARDVPELLFPALQPR